MYVCKLGELKPVSLPECDVATANMAAPPKQRSLLCSVDHSERDEEQNNAIIDHYELFGPWYHFKTAPDLCFVMSVAQELSIADDVTLSLSVAIVFSPA